MPEEEVTLPVTESVPASVPPASTTLHPTTPLPLRVPPELTVATPAVLMALSEGAGDGQSSAIDRDRPGE